MKNIRPREKRSCRYYRYLRTLVALGDVGDGHLAPTCSEVAKEESSLVYRSIRR